MPKKIAATKKQSSFWFIHLLVFILINAVLWYICYAGTEGWVYPWPIWITTAWFLLVVGHACMVWANYDDPNYDIWLQEKAN